MLQSAFIDLTQARTRTATATRSAAKGVLALLSVILLSQGFCQLVSAREPEIDPKNLVAKTDEQYWFETGLSLRQSIAPMFSSTDCSDSLRAYLGCVRMLSVLGEALPTPLNVVPTTLPPDLVARFTITAKLSERLSLAKINERTDEEKKLSANGGTKKYFAERRLLLNTLFNDLKKTQPRLPTDEDFAGIYRLMSAGLKLDSKKDAALAGEMLSAYFSFLFDPHARASPSEKEIYDLSHASASLVGIGVEISADDGRVVVNGVIEGGSAEKAGVKSGDIIEKVDGEIVIGRTADATIEKIRGVANTKVVVTFLRDGKEIEFTLLRYSFKQANVSAKLVSIQNEKAMYVRLNTFMDDSACVDMKAAILGGEKRDVKGYILDLRDNPGGLLDQAVCIGNLFLGAKTIVKTKDLNLAQAPLVDSPFPKTPAITHKPIVVLINAHSASASEVLAGALRDYKRAWLVGVRSFGKGSVQAPVEIDQLPKIWIFKTIERFYQPSGTTNQSVGISPDFAVPANPKQPLDDDLAVREEDVYWGSLPAAGEIWKPNRTKAAAKVAACVKAKGLAEKTYSPKSTNRSARDHQFLWAADVLSCN